MFQKKTEKTVRVELLKLKEIGALV